MLSECGVQVMTGEDLRLQAFNSCKNESKTSTLDRHSDAYNQSSHPDSNFSDTCNSAAGGKSQVDGN